MPLPFKNRTAAWKRKRRMNWDRSETIGLAKEACVYCEGTGLKKGRGAYETPCQCVFRAIFRACYQRFRYCMNKEKYMSKVSLVPSGSGRDSHRTYARLIEEYIADFCLVSKRTLNEFEYKVFNYHFLLGADWRLCCARLGIDRGTFFHAVYRIQQRLGRVFRELQPYSLYPVDEYFAGRVHRDRPILPPDEEDNDSVIEFPGFKAPSVRKRRGPVRPPLQKAA